MSDKEYVSLVEFKADLRDLRIKDGTDYSVIEKQGKRTLTCHSAYFDSILEVARKHDITFTRAFMYDERGWTV